MSVEPDQNGPARAPILDLVDRLEASGALGSGGRLPALLRYLVLEELAGRGDRVKAYAIATEILGRGRDFDPQTDAIVRVEIGRLRRALDLYFATHGSNEAMRIAIARGSMRPVISPTGVSASPGVGKPTFARLIVVAGLALALVLTGIGLALVLRESAVETGASADYRARVVVLPTELGGGLGGDSLRAALQTEIAAELSRPSWLAAAIAREPADVPAAEQTRLFALRPVVIASESGYAVSVALTREPRQDVIWTGRYRVQREEATPEAAARQLARAIAREIAYPTGAIGQAIVAETRQTRANEADPFLCLLYASRYWRDFEPRQFADARSCLTRLTARDASFAEGRAALAFLLIEEARAISGAAERERLFAEAASLVIAAPVDDRLSLSVKMTLAGCRRDIPALRSYADRLIAIAPNDADMLADIANELGPVALAWPEAIAAEDRALELNASPSPWYPLASSLKYALDGDHERALKRISLVPQRLFGRGLVTSLALAALAGAPQRLEAARAGLKASNRLSFPAAETIIEASCWHPDVKALLRRGLEAAREQGAL